MVVVVVLYLNKRGLCRRCHSRTHVLPRPTPQISSKSNDYAAESERDLHGSRYRVMFLCKVQQGKAFTTVEDTLTEAQVQSITSRQYHSVIGLDSHSDGRLNHEETVIYNESAAIPSYLFVYKLP